MIKLYIVVSEKDGFIAETKSMVACYNIAEKYCIKHKDNTMICIKEIDGTEENTYLFDQYDYIQYCNFLKDCGKGDRIRFLESL